MAKIVAPTQEKRLRGHLTSFGSALAMGAGGDVAGAYREARKIFDNVDVRNCPMEERWYYFWMEVFTRTILLTAASNFSSSPTVNLKDRENASPKVSPLDIRAMANAALNTEGATHFSREHLQYPERLPWAKAFHQLMKGSQSAAPAIRKITSTFFNHIGSATTEVWTERHSALIECMGEFQGPIANRAEADSSWSEHYEWLRHRVHSEALFGQPENHTLSLSALYVPLRGYIERRDSRKHNVEIFSTHQYISSWLAGDISRDPLRVISGGPGSGKSSFAKMLACEVALRGATDVVFIELQYFDGSGALLDQINDYMGRRPRGPAIKDPDLLTSTRTKPLLIVFDGLDELARSERAQIDMMRRFLERVLRLLSSISTPSRPVCAIVLGRTVAVQEAIREAQLSDDKHLHIAPFFPLTGKFFGEVEEHEVEVNDPHELKREDQRYRYWDKWQKASGSVDDAPKHLTESEFHDLTGEPLLLYLLIITGLLNNEEGLEKGIGRNAVYRQIFQRVWHRDRKIKQHLAGKGLTEEDFFILMESLGLAAWWGGGRTSSEKDYVAIRKVYAPAKHRFFQDLPSARLENITLQFYSREAHNDSRGYEFIHKSFGEYMCARALVKLAVSFCAKLELGEEEKFFRDWLFICGHQTISSDLRDFVFLEFAEMSDGQLNQVQSCLEEVCAQILSGSIISALDAKPDQSISAVARAYLCLLGILSAISRYHVFVKDKRDHRFTLRGGRSDIKRFIGLCQYVFANAEEFFTILNNISLPEGSDLSLVALPKANLRRSQLRFVDFSHSNFDEASFDEADLSEANLTLANLRRVNLRQSNCMNANFTESNMTDAFLGRCNAQKASFVRAVLLRTNFSRADLRGADFGEAYVVEANFAMCEIGSADLSRCRGLTQSQVNVAIGDSQTKLPPGIKAPSNWK